MAAAPTRGEISAEQERIEEGIAELDLADPSYRILDAIRDALRWTTGESDTPPSELHCEG